MLDGMMCVTYLIKEDLMSTSNSPGVRRATAEIHANEMGFIASLVSSSDVVQNGRVRGSPSASNVHRKTPREAGREVGNRICRLASGPRNESKYIMGVSLNFVKKMYK